MGHGEDPSPREQTECTSNRDTGESMDAFFYVSYLWLSCNDEIKLIMMKSNVKFNVFQVNSKGYKVCGEASSVCGTITINKRKVGIL